MAGNQTGICRKEEERKRGNRRRKKKTWKKIKFISFMLHPLTSEPFPRFTHVKINMIFSLEKWYLAHNIISCTFRYTAFPNNCICMPIYISIYMYVRTYIRNASGHITICTVAALQYSAAQHLSVHEKDDSYINEKRSA